MLSAIFRAETIFMNWENHSFVSFVFTALIKFLKLTVNS